MNLLILTEADRDGQNFLLSDHRAEHIRLILKGSPGETVEIGLVNGPIGTAVIGSIDESKVVLINAVLKEPLILAPTVDLIVALPRPQTLKKVLALAATMAVRRIHLIRANRVEKSYYASPLLEPENYQKQLLEGMSQGKQTRMPEVIIHDRFKPFFQDTPGLFDKNGHGHDIRLLCDCEAKRSLSSVVTEPVNSLMIAVGPEGGWVPFETELMRSVGFLPISLGRFTLRVESAVTAVLSQLEQTLLDGPGEKPEAG